MPYTNAAVVTRIYFFLNFFCPPQHHNTTIVLKRPICTHLSNHILLSQSSLGKADPGKTSSIVQRISQPAAGNSEGFII